jgi:ATP adenylyltransferase
MECVFCKMLEAREPTFGQGDHFVCRLDIHPVSPGHVLIIPKRHVTSVADLKGSEWKELQILVRVFNRTLTWPSKAKWEETYRRLRERRITENSVWFLDRALAHPRLGEEPDGFNHIVNEGMAAGQTVSHLHWHIIPRYRGDMEDPSGGGRYVIPEMGNYKTPRQ